MLQDNASEKIGNVPSGEVRMYERVVREETGMTMGLVVIMIVLIGVMGAGLLTFVQRDLEAVVEVNQGQRAFELADAGVQIARQQIRRDANREHYDIDDAVRSDYYNDACNDPGGDSTAPARFGDNWSPQAGATKTFSDGSVTVTIRWLSRDALADTRCKAPIPATTEPVLSEFFRVTSTGEHNGAKRRVEAVMNTYDLGVPKAYFSQTGITTNGDTCVTDASLFSLGPIETGNSGAGSGCSDTGNIVQGRDLAYGTWQGRFNSTGRGTTNAGFGTPNSISGGSKTAGRDFDSSTSPRFVQDNPTSGQITFPFDYTTQSGSVDADRLQFYQEEARYQEGIDGQDHHMELSNSADLTTWPANSDSNTVVYVKFTGSGGDLTWRVPGACDVASRKKGTLVIENGNLIGQSPQALFSGVIIIRGGAVRPGTYTASGNDCLEGFVNASGTITLGGNTAPSTNLDANNTPGFYGVRVWSWREMYK